MEYFAGLNVGRNHNRPEGKVMLETTVGTDPDAIFKALKSCVARLRRVGQETGSLSPWPLVELKQRGLPAICLEA